MNSAIINNPTTKCTALSRVWEEIDRRMQAGSTSAGLSPLWTGQPHPKQAAMVVAGVETDLAGEGIIVFDVIREF